MKWLQEHLSGILEKALATLLAAGVLYLLTFVPRVGPALSTRIALPVWLLTSIPVAAGLMTVLYRRAQAKRRAADALSFEKIVRQLDTRQIAAKKIGEIRFDYLPDTPLANGWALGLENGNIVPPSFSAATDAPIVGSMSIEARGRYYMNYTVDPHATFCDRVGLTARFSKDTMFYAKVRIESRDGSKSKVVWLGQLIGSTRHKQLNDEEWQLSAPAEILENGWASLMLSLPDQVLSSFGQQGWIYAQLVGFRVRGSLSISPIMLYRSHSAEVGSTAGSFA